MHIQCRVRESSDSEHTRTHKTHIPSTFIPNIPLKGERIRPKKKSKREEKNKEDAQSSGRQRLAGAADMLYLLLTCVLYHFYHTRYHTA
jgi:hypothetical protein